MVHEWPPTVWQGVIDPVTGEKIPPIKCKREQYQQRQEREKQFEERKREIGFYDGAEVKVSGIDG